LELAHAAVHRLTPSPSSVPIPRVRVSDIVDIVRPKFQYVLLTGVQAPYNDEDALIAWDPAEIASRWDAKRRRKKRKRNAE
jgi:hypothetical protein